MTTDEKEAILVELFNNKKEKEDETKNVYKEIRELKVLKSRVAKELSDLGPLKREAYLSLMGKGKYAEIIMKPVKLKNELVSLETSANISYDGEYDRKAVKAYQGKGPVLKEDIEIAEIESNKAEKEISDIITEYIDLVARKKGINKSLKNQKRILKELSKELRKINKKIKQTDKKKTKERVLGRTK